MSKPKQSHQNDVKWSQTCFDISKNGRDDLANPYLARYKSPWYVPKTDDCKCTNRCEADRKENDGVV